jgi:hypothetical protein
LDPSTAIVLDAALLSAPGPALMVNMTKIATTGSHNTLSFFMGSVQV